MVNVVKPEDDGAIKVRSLKAAGVKAMGFCDARGRHTVESARQGQLYRLIFCTEYANECFVPTGLFIRVRG